MAATTAGCACPTLFTPMPASRSMYSRPSRVVTVAPRARTTSRQSGVSEVWQTCRRNAVRRSVSIVRVQSWVRDGGLDLFEHPGVLLAAPALAKGVAGILSAEPAERPGGMTSHERLLVPKRGYQRRHGRRVSTVAEGDADIPQETAAPGPLHGAAAECRAE